MDISDILGNARTFTKQVGDSEDQTVTITYRPRSTSAKELQKLQAWSQNEDEHQGDLAEALCRLLADLLVDWDLTDGGEPLGTDLDSLVATDQIIVQLALGWIQEDLAGGGDQGNREARRKASRSGSRSRS